MPAKNVAVEGDIVAKPSSTFYGKAVSGKWTADLITVESYEHLTITKHNVIYKVIYKASCEFSFSGTGPSPDYESVKGSGTVTLEANTTRLMKGKSNVLVQGDSKTDSYGNNLAVQSTTNKLKTS